MRHVTEIMGPGNRDMIVSFTEGRSAGGSTFQRMDG